MFVESRTGVDRGQELQGDLGHPQQAAGGVEMRVLEQPPHGEGHGAVVRHPFLGDPDELSEGVAHAKAVYLTRSLGGRGVPLKNTTITTTVRKNRVFKGWFYRLYCSVMLGVVGWLASQ